MPTPVANGPLGSTQERDHKDENAPPPTGRIPQPMGVLFILVWTAVGCLSVAHVCQALLGVSL